MGIFNRILYTLNMLALFALALSYLAPHISPSTFLWPVAFLGLLYPLLLGVNILFTLYWIITFKRHFWSNLFIILIGYGHIQTLLKFQKLDAETGNRLSVMSFNVRLFNVYEWIEESDIKKDIVDFMKRVYEKVAQRLMGLLKMTANAFMDMMGLDISGGYVRSPF